MSRLLRIALDGPSGAGKSYLASMLARHFHLVHVDTGALYRAVGLYVCRAGADPEDSAAVEALLPQIALSLRFGEEGQETLLCGENVSAELRTPEISRYASLVSALPAVRAFLLETQRQIASTQSVILDGRDIGTVILPDADVKIYLFADDETRAARRCAELREKGLEVREEEILAQIRERDARDSGRAASPAKPAEDAVLLDNSHLTREQTLARAIRITEQRLAERAAAPESKAETPRREESSS